VPVINENDSVATNEIRFGDNDRLAARVAAMMQAEVLVLLSDIDGLYTADPRRNALAAHLPVVEALTPAG
jgi:glutamate 5-kinase